MPIVQISGLRYALANMQWRRGLRAGLAVAVAMLVCRLLHRPMGWAALGGLNVSTIDNGGPYRTRLSNMLTVLLPGCLGVLAGTLAAKHLPVAIAVTFVFCFAFTLLRVLSQPLAAGSVFILICYIVAYGASAHTLASAGQATLGYLCGGLWAALLALVFWPVDPFRPARTAVAAVYTALQDLSAALPATAQAAGALHFNEAIARTRTAIEAAQAALAATPARMTARTIRARNLSVLTESADLLLARILRFAELAVPGTDTATGTATNDPPEASSTLSAIDRWLRSSLAPIEAALLQRPLNNARAFIAGGSLALELHRAETHLEAALAADAALPPGSHAPLRDAVRDALFNLGVAFEAVRAIWTGAESRQPRLSDAITTPQTPSTSARSAVAQWLEVLRANLTLRSVMCRHALRLASVVTFDVLFMRVIHVDHGYWLPMTSLIVLRPFAGETVARSSQRVLGTISGGILAALLTAVLPSESGLLGIIVVTTVAAIALYAVDYAWYCFFLTPTIVLLMLPHLHDWHLAAVRIGFTGLGALIAVLAMLLLWPERESLQLPGLLARAAAADAAYLRATLAFWQAAAGHKRAARIESERTLLAPARRLCGLAVNDAEETLDHALLEHSIPLNPRRSHTQRLNSAALTFTTYLRRLTRTITTLAAIPEHHDDPTTTHVIQQLATRLDAAAEALSSTLASVNTEWSSRPKSSQLYREDAAERPVVGIATGVDLTTDHLRRLDRQVSILERSAAEIAAL